LRVIKKKKKEATAEDPDACAGAYQVFFFFCITLEP